MIGSCALWQERLREGPLDLANSGLAPLQSCFVQYGSFSLASSPEAKSHSRVYVGSSLAVKLSTLTPRIPFRQSLIF